MSRQILVSYMTTVIGLTGIVTTQTAATPELKAKGGVDDSHIIIQLNRYLGGEEATLADKPALSFKFSNGSSDDVCSIITTDNYLRHSNNRLENINLSEPNFYFDCIWNDSYYFLSNRYRTYAEVIIKQPDSEFPMSMHIEAKLVSVTGDKATIISGDIPLKRVKP